ncbi:MAG TPA: hypothetical protein VHE33_20470, partial [Acidobacteriaceae bacterium]|nr:hypothetical protein [Acidobacteriaceae bacterium]
MKKRLIVPTFFLAGIGVLPLAGNGQATRAEYDRALNLQKNYEGLPIDLPDNVSWLPAGDRFIYRKSIEGGHEFVLVDAATQTKQPAFDHTKLAAALSSASGENYTAITLPFARFHFTDGDAGIEFAVENTRWQCDLHTWT